MNDATKMTINSSLAVEDALRRLFLLEINERNLKEILSLSQNFDENLKAHKFIKALEEISSDVNLINETRYEFNALFVGPRRPKALPYESTYFDYKNMFGKETFEVREYYKSVGLKVEDDKFDKFPDDFIGYELQYLYFVSFLALDRLSLDELSDFYEILEQKKEFIDSHPSRWFGQFASSCEKGANLQIWKSFADFLVVYLKNETENLKHILAKKG